MDSNTAIALGRQVLEQSLVLATPILGVSLVVGVVIALFQALTSLQEQTVTMVPKLLALGGTLFILMPWILRQLVEFAQHLMMNLARYGAGS